MVTIGRFKMKKVTALVLMSLLTVFLSSCDPYFDLKPPAHPNSRWVSEDPDIFFVVEKIYYQSEKYIFEMGEDHYYTCNGILNVDNRSIKIKVEFDEGTGVYILDLKINHERKRETILRGNAKFRESHFILTIDKDYVGELFDSSVKRITFYREDIDE